MRNPSPQDPQHVLHRLTRHQEVLYALACFLAAIVLVLVMARPARAADWERQDSMQLGAALALHTLDWAQTRTVAQHPDQFQEYNAFLGAHPSLGAVNRYFFVTGALYSAAVLLLPSRIRRPLQYFYIGMEAGAVAHNLSAGIRFSF